MFFFAATSPLVAGDTYSIDAVHSDVSFKIRHLVSKTAGRFAEFSGNIDADFQNLEASSVEFVIQAGSIDTRDERRDNHLRSADFFDVENFPEITFTSHEITKSGDDSYAVAGTLTMHGVAKEITLPVTYLGQAKDPRGNVKAGFETSTTLDRKEFGISWNRALDSGGLILGDEVQISISLEVAKQ
jgi:polyisoprenoid-binding protein YceI